MITSNDAMEQAETIINNYEATIKNLRRKIADLNKNITKSGCCVAELRELLALCKKYPKNSFYKTALAIASQRLYPFGYVDIGSDNLISIAPHSTFDIVIIQKKEALQ